MWYPASVTVEADLPVSTDEARTRLHIDDNETEDDIGLIIAAATDHAEKYCNVRFATQTIVAKCDGFSDFAHLPEAPVQSISGVTYIDVDGATQTLATSVYELRADNLEAAIVLKYGQSWPATQSGSRVIVTAIVGYDIAPPAVRHAILLFVGDSYLNKENAAVPSWTAFDALLSNYRRGI